MSVSTFKIIVWLLFAALGGVTLVAAGDISGVSFDPLGSRAVPYGLGVFLLVLLAMDIFAEWYAKMPDDDPVGSVTFLQVAAVLSISIVYSISVYQVQLPFSIMTLILVPVAAYALMPDLSVKATLTRLAMGAVVGFGGEILFTKVFFVDLPSLW